MAFSEYDVTAEELRVLVAMLSSLPIPYGVDISPLVLLFESRVDAARRGIRVPIQEYPAVDVLRTCLGAVIPAVAERFDCQPAAWSSLLPAATLLFELYQKHALAQQTSGRLEPTFQAAGEFRRFMEPMDRIANTLARTDNLVAFDQVTELIVQFVTRQMEMVSVHCRLSNKPEKWFYRKTLRAESVGWLGLLYGFMDPRLGLRTDYSPLHVLRIAERSTPVGNGVGQQQAYALHLIKDDVGIQGSVDALAVEQLFALRPAHKIWGNAHKFCMVCKATLNDENKHRACRYCRRPVYCSYECRKSDWDGDHRRVCQFWKAVDGRLRGVRAELRVLIRFAS